MKYLIFLFIPVFSYAQERQVTIELTDIVLEKADTEFDIAAPGAWFVQFAQKDWVKLGKTLYPDKADRTRAVIDDQDAFKVELDRYVIEALRIGAYSQGTGKGVTLSQRIIFGYVAVKFKDGDYCKIYVRHKNKQYVLTLFPDLNDETGFARATRANMVAQLARIIGVVKTGGHHE